MRRRRVYNQGPHISHIMVIFNVIGSFGQVSRAARMAEYDRDTLSRRVVSAKEGINHVLSALSSIA